MNHAVSKRYAFVILAALAAGLTMLFSGCASVPPWEKGMLADPVMQFASDQKGSVQEQHMLSAREASSGGYGGGGGGCGCK